MHSPPQLALAASVSFVARYHHHNHRHRYHHPRHYYNHHHLRYCPSNLPLNPSSIVVHSTLHTQVNMHYVPDTKEDGSKKIWSDLFEKSSTKLAWKKIMQELNKIGWAETSVTEIRDKLLKTYGQKPVSYIVEVQLILDEYLAMRKQRFICAVVLLTHCNNTYSHAQ